MLNRPGRVLVVEDDVKTSEMVAMYLRHAGYDVAQSFDGETALQKSQSWEPDLVVLDLMLPRASGIEVCARLHGALLALTPTEFGLLFALCRLPKIVRTRDELIAEVIGFDYEGTERTIDVHVRNLRRKIGEAGASRTHIRAVFGAGYKIES